MNQEMYNRLAKSVVRKLVKDALAAGYLISVNDGEETTVTKSQDIRVIMKAVMTTDEDYLRFYKPDNLAKSAGTVYLVYGNDPWEVICDYHVSLNALLEGVNAFAAKMEAKYG